MSTHIVLLRSREDEQYQKYLKIFQSCKDAGISFQGKVIKHLKETEDQTWCKCDTCTLIRLKAEDKEIIGSLAYAGLEYLLGENFNGAAALYYYSYFLLQGNGKK
jgi:hypothetical protein